MGVGDHQTRSSPPTGREPANGGASGANAAAEPPTRAKRRRSPWAIVAWASKWLLWVGILCLVAGAGAVIGVVRHYESKLPSVDELRSSYHPPQVTRVLAADGTLLAQLFVERRTVVDIATIPAHAKQAFLAAEDASFYEHEGLDYLGMLRALAANLRAGHTVQGGSTITQQVVKNLLLDSERTYDRKIKETLLARRIEQRLTKDEIFSRYLNQIYLGHGRYGVEEAARYYFGKHARELNLPESATLAGLVAAPERYSPRRNPRRNLQRRGFVLDQMLRKGFITSELHDDAVNAPLRLAPAADAESDIAPEAVPWVRRVLSKATGEAAARGGFTVSTTLDPALQTRARELLRLNLDAYAKRMKLAPPYRAKHRELWGPISEAAPRRYGIYVGEVTAVDDSSATLEVRIGTVRGHVFLNQEDRYNPKRLPPSEFASVGASLRVGVLGDPAEEGGPQLRLELGPQSALVAIDVRTRDIRALLGSYEAITGGLDRATMAKRQPGSTFKPFTYSYALFSKRYTPASAFDVKLRGHSEPEHVLLRQGLARSLNPVAEEVLAGVGAGHVVEWAHSLGIDSKLGATPSLTLGAYEVRPVEMANAYATFASGGLYAPPRLVGRIANADGQSVPLPAQPPARRALGADVAYLTTSLLQSVVREGTGRRAAALGRPVAGKTGTTNQAKDAWFVGYSTDFAVAVWVGYDDALPLGPGESGARTALPLWVEFMKAAHQGRPVTRFPRPAGIIVQRIDPETGRLAPADQEGAIDEEFLDGTAPLPADDSDGADDQQGADPFGDGAAGAANEPADSQDAAASSRDQGRAPQAPEPPPGATTQIRPSDDTAGGAPPPF